MSWHEVALGDAIHVKHGFAFKSQYFSDSGEFIVLTPGNFNEEGGFRLRPDKDRFYTGDIPEDYVLDEGDLVVAMTEQGPGLLGSSALIPEGGKYLHNQRLGLIQEMDNKALDKRFLYYLFNTRPVRGQISGSATGTKVRHTAPERIYRVRVTVPTDVNQQRHIASTLFAYDDLIENNRRRIQLLEQAARLLHKEWFVRLRFPGHEHVKVKDGVPEGWEKVSVSSFCNVSRGGSPRPIKDYLGGTVPWFKIGDATSSESPFVFLTNDRIIDDGVRKSVLLPPQELILSNSATCGIPYFTGISGCIHDGWLYFKKLQRISKWFLYCGLFAKQHEIIMGIGEGATQKNLNTNYIGRLALLLPTDDTLLRSFDDVVHPLFDQIFSLAQQNRQLTQARDLLLPQLMSGEVVV